MMVFEGVACRGAISGLGGGVHCSAGRVVAAGAGLGGGGGGGAGIVVDVDCWGVSATCWD